MMSIISECEEKYLVMIRVATMKLYGPMAYFEEAKASMNFTSDENEEPKYWHVVLYKNDTGKMIHLLSKPTIREFDFSRFSI